MASIYSKYLSESSNVKSRKSIREELDREELIKDAESTINSIKDRIESLDDSYKVKQVSVEVDENASPNAVQVWGYVDFENNISEDDYEEIISYVIPEFNVIDGGFFEDSISFLIDSLPIEEACKSKSKDKSKKKALKEEYAETEDEAYDKMYDVENHLIEMGYTIKNIEISEEEQDDRIDYYGYIALDKDISGDEEFKKIENEIYDEFGVSASYYQDNVLVIFLGGREVEEDEVEEACKSKVKTKKKPMKEARRTLKESSVSVTMDDGSYVYLFELVLKDGGIKNLSSSEIEWLSNIGIDMGISPDALYEFYRHDTTMLVSIVDALDAVGLNADDYDTEEEAISAIEDKGYSVYTTDDGDKVLVVL